jgi:hypothetical protein
MWSIYAIGSNNVARDGVETLMEYTCRKIERPGKDRYGISKEVGLDVVAKCQDERRRKLMALREEILTRVP